jgi:hypothetical protein
MAISIDGSAGTITGVGVGGLPDGIVDADMLATDAVTSAKILNATIASGDLASGVGGKVLQRKSTSTFNSSAWTFPTSETDYLTLSMTAVSVTSKYVIEVHAGAVWFPTASKWAYFIFQKDGSYLGPQVSGYGMGYIHSTSANSAYPATHRLVVSSASGDYKLRVNSNLAKFYEKSEVVYSITEVEV